MAKTELTNLIETAIGDDRTVRDYAKAADVSYTTIYRILNGETIPTRKVMRKLTSFEAAPRGGVTYEQLCNATEIAYAESSFSSSEIAAMLAGVAALGAAASGPIGWGVSIASLSAFSALRELKKSPKAQDKLVPDYNETLTDEQKLYLRKINAIIISGLARSALKFRIAENHADKPDEIRIQIEDGPITGWNFNVLMVNNDLLSENAESLVKILLSQYSLLEPNSEAKYSLVVSDDVSFENIIKFKGKISLKTNLSVIQVDIEHFNIAREEYICTFSDSDPDGQPILEN